MKKITEDVDNLIVESNIKAILAGGSLIAIAALFGFILNPAITLTVYLTKTLLSYLLFSIVVGGGVVFSASIYSKIKDILDIDDFLKSNFTRLNAHGYDGIDDIQKRAISARDNVITGCEGRASDKVEYYILKPECAKKGLIVYMEVSATGLFSYYLNLLMKKGISLEKASSIEHILSSREELPFVTVLSKIYYKYIEILEFIKYDTSKFSSKILEDSKKHVNFTRSIQPNNQQKFIPRFKR